MDELLDVLEFAEGALSNLLFSEDPDYEAGRRVAFMVSEMVEKHGRTSVIVEARKQPEL